jgi:hypothetical protein
MAPSYHSLGLRVQRKECQAKLELRIEPRNARMLAPAPYSGTSSPIPMRYPT